MKKFLYKIFKKEVFRRALRIKVKQEARLERLKQVVKDLNLWDDIPLREQLPARCATLMIKPNSSAYRLMLALLVSDADLEELAKSLPLM